MSEYFNVFGHARTKTLAVAGVPDFTGVSFHTSAQSLPIALHWGTRRLSPQVIWQASVLYGLVIGAPGFAPLGLAGSGPFGGALPGGVRSLKGPDLGGDGWSDAGGAFNITPGAAMFSIQIASPSSLIATYGFGAPFNALFYGSRDPNSSDCHWYVPMILALCEGPITGIPRYWNGGGSGARSETFPAQYNPALKPPSLFYTQFDGTSAQTAWNFFAVVNALTGGPYYAGQDLAYRNTCYFASTLVDCGHDNHAPQGPPQQSFEVVRTPNSAFRALDSYGFQFDYSFADIIPDLLTNLQYGMGLSAGDIDSVSLTSAANSYRNYCFAQGLYFSPLLNAQASCVSILDRFAVESNTWIYWDGTIIRFVPLGDETITGNGQTYTPDFGAAYALTNADFVAGIQVSRADPYDCHNRVRIEISDRFNDYAKNPIEWKDETLIGLYGLRDASNIDGSDICDSAVGAKAVELYGKRMAYIRNLYSFTLNSRFIRILPGCLLLIGDPNLGLNGIAVRVQSVEEDEKGDIAIVAEEFPGTLGICRPRPVQAWSQTAGSSGTPSVGGGAPGPSTLPIPTTGGGLVMDQTMQIVLFVAGDIMTAPNMLPGVRYVFKHDQLRSPQPTTKFLETNPARINRPTGATFNFEDPQDGTAAVGTFASLATSGCSYTFVFDGVSIVRSIQQVR